VTVRHIVRVAGLALSLSFAFVLSPRRRMVE